MAIALVLFLLGAYYGEAIKRRLDGWREPASAPAKPVAAAKKLPSAKPHAKTERPRPAPEAAPPEAPLATAPVALDSPDSEEAVAPAPSRARVAVVLDDLGRDVNVVSRLSRALAAAGDAQISWAVLPFEDRTSAVVEALRGHGAELLLHLPMDPQGREDPGPGALTLEMRRSELVAATAAALAAVPGAVGVNNHMGSRLSSDREAMTAILGEVRREGRYFLDSRTAATSVGFAVARELGIPAAERDLFLDDDPRPEAIRSQFAKLLELARARGAAIGIGHPHPATVAVLESEIPRAAALGIEFVPVSYLLERSEELPE